MGAPARAQEQEVSSAPRVVLDTNVVLSVQIFSRGRISPLRQACQHARCRPLISRASTEELIRALTYPKFKLTAGEQQELLADYLPYCTTVRIPPKPPKTPKCRDPFDIWFLQLAIAGKADFLVTGDKDLLSLAGQLTCPIIAADQLLNKLG